MGTVVSQPLVAGSIAAEDEKEIFHVPDFMLRDPSLPFTYNSADDETMDEDEDEGWPNQGLEGPRR